MPTKTPKKKVRPDRSNPNKELELPFSYYLLVFLIRNKVQNVNNYWDLAENLIDRLVAIMSDASAGNVEAATQLKAIEKVIHPGKFELPRTKIDELATRYHTNPQLARGWELTALMSHLSYVVEPRDKDHCSPGDAVVITANPKLEGSLEEVKAVVEITQRYWKPNSTLQSLAIRMYLDSLEREGVTDADAKISERSLKRDLQAVREWEKTATDEQRLARGVCAGRSLGEGVAFWYQFSEGWKDRRKTKKQRGAPKKTRN